MVDKWWEDKYCDEQLNTKECGYDGGDCCKNDFEEFDKYCKPVCF